MLLDARLPAYPSPSALLWLYQKSKVGLTALSQSFGRAKKTHRGQVPKLS
jgi:hypothetical protein